ncbi:MAG: AmmeMemoRadiSam system radical SAM enzyme [Candidatus Omnitrophica bacterium]|nr:AmmeMemoRadiSam system radical SAM enzyme [Candidatus Omnitrophota bacterium]
MNNILEKINRVWDKKLTRREFINKCLKAGLLFGAASSLFDIFSRYKAYAAIGEKRGLHEALYYEKIGDEAVKCLLCPNQCVLSDGQRGFCRVREPVKGKLYTLVYELVCAQHVDPIEKKPLFHVLPGSTSYSIATSGCNSRCKYCQNWTISQKPPEETFNERLTCESLVRAAAANGCDSISYTYTDPIVFYEYVLAASKAARNAGILNVAVTGGKINPEPLRELCGFIDAAHIDFKGFNDRFLNEVCAQRLDTITETIKIMKNAGVWIELVNLIVPTLNDDMGDLRKMVKWIRSNVGPDVPLHFSRFWPQYKLRSLYPTPVETLKQARDIALEEGINYVYIGNVPELEEENTICPSCKKAVIKRAGYSVRENNLEKGKCRFCGQVIPGIWEKPGRKII